MFNMNTLCNYEAFNHVNLNYKLDMMPEGRIISKQFHTDEEKCMTITYKSTKDGQR